MKTKIIFLDIDGVLCLPPKWHSVGFSKECCDNLTNILNSTDAKIVISSTWRRSKQDLAEMRKHMVQHGVDITQIIDCTPFMSLSGSGRRGQEIQNWLDNHPEIDTFVVIDDEIWDMDPISDDKIINTLTETGLTKELADKTIEILNKI